MVDADPQCNLTAYTLGLNSTNDFEAFYDSKKNDDIFSVINPIIEGSSLNPVAIKQTGTKNNNLFVAAGNIGMSELDISLSLALAGGRFIQFSQQFVGAFYATIKETSKVFGYDFVLIDMSPSASALNRCILMSSDYFIVPTSPDFFCFQAINSLSTMLPQWLDDFRDFRSPKVKNSLPKNPPKMLGIISQKYRPYKTSKDDGKDKAKSFQRWIDRIQEASHSPLAENLKKVNMVIDEDQFKKYVQREKPYNLINIPDFNSLISCSQDYNKPIFELSKEELGYKGIAYENAKENQKTFSVLFNNLSKIICDLISSDMQKR